MSGLTVGDLRRDPKHFDEAVLGAECGGWDCLAQGLLPENVFTGLGWWLLSNRPWAGGANPQLRTICCCELPVALSGQSEPPHT